jgi:Ca-activated chloride channel family protein
VPANNAAELKDALAQIQDVMDQQPPAVVPEPVPEPAPAPAVSVTGPAQVTRGAEFDVSWSPTFDARDFVTIVPVGADAGAYTDYIRTDGKTEGVLTAPPETGLYELRYVSEDGRVTLGTAPVEVIDAEVTVAGPAQIATGASFEVTWSGAVNPRDYITIVPVGAAPGSYTDYVRVDTATAGKLTAPGDAGLYELRYVLDTGGATLATAAIEVVEPEVTVAGPAQVTTGASFDVSWTGSVNPRDYITIAPAGAAEGSYTDSVRVSTDTSGRLTAPADAGFYELRYVLDEGQKTLATAGIEVVTPEIGISGPATVFAGARFEVSWAGAVNPRDYLTVVPAGAAEGGYTDYVRTESRTSGLLTAPTEAGLYELRYVLEEGQKTLASIPIEVTEATVTVEGPGVVRAGTPVKVTWSQTVNERDYLTIVPAGADQGSYTQYIRTGTLKTVDLKGPTEPGLYEIRYVLEAGGKTLATTPLEVVAADAPLDDGAGLSVPTTATAGETITVTWTGGSDGADQRIALARIDQPDLSWVVAQPVSEGKTMQLTMPDASGTYEVRYLDISNRRLLGRAVIVVN